MFVAEKFRIQPVLPLELFRFGTVELTGSFLVYQCESAEIDKYYERVESSANSVCLSGVRGDCFQEACPFWLLKFLRRGIFW